MNMQRQYSGISSIGSLGLKGLLQRLHVVALLALVVSCVIFPNSLKVTAAAALFIGFLCSALLVKLDNNVILVLIFWLSSAVVTSVYLLVGVGRGAPPAAVGQMILIYIVFPFAWIVVLAYALQVHELRRVTNGLIVAGVIACLSVPVFYVSFLAGWEKVAKFFIDVPNVDISKEGYVAATMHVFGSLIFIIGGYVASFRPKGGSRARFLILPLFVITALVSGRSALILAIVIGLCINGMVSVGRLNGRVSPSLGKSVIIIALSCGLVIVVMNYFGLSFTKILEPAVRKIVTAGGAGRVPQLQPLLDGADSSLGFGAGHGIGVSYIADPRYPWRYEMIWLASVFRVGLLGTLVYAAPFIVAMLVALRAMARDRLRDEEVFLIGGFFSAFVASNTNPYLEAFVFQWMYVLPVLYLISRASFKLRLGVGRSTEVLREQHGNLT